MDGVQRVGLHMRLDGSLMALAQKALRLQLPFFQCFLVLLTTNKLIKLTPQQVDEFVEFRRRHFKQLYMHGSYWINLASLQYNGYGMFKKELALAKKLEFTHMILHPGSAKGAQNVLEGINALAQMLNKIMQEEQEITFVLENTAHGNMSVGSNLQDFKQLLEQLEQPERIAFCVDTSHAYAYGYDISTIRGQEEFIQLLDDTMGLHRIVLIHLNDTKELMGSRIDRHDVVGQGRLGQALLKHFVMHPKLCKIPIVLELPVLEEPQEVAILQDVIDWHK